MSRYVTATYENLWDQQFRITSDTVYLRGAYKISRRRAYKNKLIVAEKATNQEYYFWDPFMGINERIRNNNIMNDRSKTLFITPECQLSRDVIRNSGYKITINRDNADYVVIPYKRVYEKYDCDGFARKGSDIYLLKSIEKAIYGDDINLNAVRKEFENYGFTDIIFGTELRSHAVYLLTNFPVYKEIFDNDCPNTKYLYENKLELTPGVEMSVETLNVWKNITEEDMRNKLLLNADWQHYPVTIMYFCHKYWYSVLYYARTPKVASLFENMDWDKEHDISENIFKSRRLIQPEDWNMLTKFVLSELNLPENGGFRNDDLTELERRILRHTNCVAPYFITEPLLAEQIEKMK